MERILEQEKAYLAGEREAEIEELRNDPTFHEWLDMLDEQSREACTHDEQSRAQSREQQ
jgi:hypothetical protein